MEFSAEMGKMEEKWKKQVLILWWDVFRGSGMEGEEAEGGRWRGAFWGNLHILIYQWEAGRRN